MLTVTSYSIALFVACLSAYRRGQNLYAKTVDRLQQAISGQRLIRT